MNRCQWQWKVFFLQVVGMVTAVHWCIVFFSRLMGGLKRCVVWVQVHSVLSVWKEHCVIDQHHAYLNEPICEHTYMHKHTRKAVPLEGHLFTLSRCLPSGYLVLQATLQIPAGILVHPLTRVERWGPSKCAAKFGLPAQWDTRCTALQRGYASPTGPGLGDSRSANVSEIWNDFVMQMSQQKLRDFIFLQFGFAFWLQRNKYISGLYVFHCIKYLVKLCDYVNQVYSCCLKTNIKF